MKIPAFLRNRVHWLNFPSAFLMLLLQRTPAATLVAAADEIVAAAPLGNVLKSALAAAAALGAVNTVVGATPLVPSSGTANGVTVTTGNAVSIFYTVNGTQTPPQSWSVTGNFPPGLNFSGLTSDGGVNTVSLHLSGTPTTAGTYNVTITAFEFTNEGGISSPPYSYTVTVTGGNTATAPSFTTQPASQTAAPGNSVTFTAAATGSPAPTLQWKKDGNDIAGATNASFTIASVAAGDAGTYTVVATNSAGSATSNGATLTVSAANVAPEITSSPSGVIVAVGGTASFSVTATGTPAPTFQWRKDGNNIAGATNATFTIASVALGDVGHYSAVATNAGGSVISGSATLTVTTTASTHLADVTIASGGSTAFDAGAQGGSTQWQLSTNNGATWTDLTDTGPYSGATTVVLTLTNVSQSLSGSRYRFVNSNNGVIATSNGATLTVTAATSAPSFTTQPASQTAAPGSSVTFTAAASGDPTPTYQWRKDGNNLAGATAATFTIASVAAGDAGAYTVVATNSAGSATSVAATLTVSAATAAPSFTTQPTNQTAALGTSVTFTAAASGNPAPTYQWRKDGNNLAGATNASYAIASVATSDAGTYTVVATNSQGSATSNAATLTVSATAARRLTDVTVTSGHGTTFTAGNVSGSVQWQISTNGGSTWANVSDGGSYGGATTATLTISNVGSSLNGAQYRFVTTNNGVVTTSNGAMLTVATVFFPFPTGIAIDGSGNLFVADANADTVQKINSSSQVSLVAGSANSAGTTDGTGAAARFNQPNGVVVLSGGGLVVADTANATLRAVDANGAVTTLAGSSATRGGTDGTGTAATFSAPVGLARDGSGILFVADSMNHTIRKVTSAGAVTTFAGSAGAQGSADGVGAAARFNLPNGVAVDANGVAYVADTTNNTVRRIAADGTVATLAGLAGVSGFDNGTGMAALFNRPMALVVDGAGNLFVADTGNSTIRKVTSAGVVTTFAGTAGIAGIADGTGADALFNQPQSLTIDAAGNLYVADTGNAAIRKITPAGVVSTLALTAAPAPAPNPNPNPTPAPNPSPSMGGGGGGGGGASSVWLPLSATLLLALRQRRRSRLARRVG